MMKMLCYRCLYCKIKYYAFDLMNSQVNLSFLLNLSSFINEVCERDYINNFIIDQMFLITRDDLIVWV